MSSWNDSVGSNTWREILSEFDPNNIACISFREEPPSENFSKNYFIVSESAVIKNVFKKTKCCYKYEKDDLLASINEHNLSSSIKIRSKRHFFYFFKKMIREFLWKISRWKTKELVEFIKNFNPDYILFFMDGYIYFNDFCRFVIDNTSAKSIGYFVDDTFSYKQRIGVGFKILRFFQRTSLRKLVKKTDYFWAITDKTKKEADKLFKIDCTVITKPIKKQTTEQFNFNNWPLQILYTGNLGIGRDKTLKKLVSELIKVNKNNIYFNLDVYTSSNVSIKCANKASFVSLIPSIPQSEALKKQSDADILLFVEGTSLCTKNIARLSFSTKITDYLSCGKPILAIGNKSIAPIEYLLKHNACLDAHNKKSIRKCLLQIINNPAILSEISKNSISLGLSNHNDSIIKERINSFLIGC